MIRSLFHPEAVYGGLIIVLATSACGFDVISWKWWLMAVIIRLLNHHYYDYTIGSNHPW